MIKSTNPEPMPVSADRESDFCETDKRHWNDFYSRNCAEQSPSPFAQYVRDFLSEGQSLLEIGCGNGRDSIYFNKSNIAVTAVDQSTEAISLILEKKLPGLSCICGDMISILSDMDGVFDHCYSRFSLHALTASDQSETIRRVYRALRGGGFFWIETRSVKDTLFGEGKEVAANTYFHDGHTRRFIVLDELVRELQECGFSIVSAEESAGFAPYQHDDPIVIRVRAVK